MYQPNVNFVTLRKIKNLFIYSFDLTSDFSTNGARKVEEKSKNDVENIPFSIDVN